MHTSGVFLRKDGSEPLNLHWGRQTGEHRNHFVTQLLGSLWFLVWELPAADYVIANH